MYCIRSQLRECQSQKTCGAIHWVTNSTAARLKAGRASCLASHPGGRGVTGSWGAPRSEHWQELLGSSFLLWNICPEMLWLFGCLRWLPCCQPSEKPREEFVSPASGRAVPEHVCAAELLVSWRGSGCRREPVELASTCAVAVLQGTVMNKQLEKLPFFFFFFFLSLSSDTATRALKLA